MTNVQPVADAESVPEVNAETVLRKIHDVKWREEDHGLLVCNHRGEYMMLNKTGQMLWELIDGNRTVGELMEAVKQAYNDAPPEKVEQDVMTFARSAIKNLMAETN